MRSKSYLSALPFVLGSALLSLSGSRPLNAAGNDVKPVTVVNGPANPVPAQIVGTASIAGTVNIGNSSPIPVQTVGTATVSGNVTVTTSEAAPLSTKSVDEPGRHPYIVRQTFTLTCSPVIFEESRQRQCNASFPPVPPGKRLVIQHVSGDLIVDSSIGSDPLQITGLVQGQSARISHFLAVSFLTNVSSRDGSFLHEIYRLNETTQMFIDPGDAPQIGVLYLTDRLKSDLLGGSMTISGYLVDLQ